MKARRRALAEGTTTPLTYRAVDMRLARKLLEVLDEHRSSTTVAPVYHRAPSGAEFEPAGHANVWFERFGGIGDDLSDVSLVLTMWRHFELANETFRKDFGYIELDGFNRYGRSQLAPTHVDNDQARGSEHRILSMTVCLSKLSAYTGGELVLDPGEPDRHGVADGHVVRLGFGGVVVFDASVRHRVNVITSGERLAYIARVTNGPTTAWCRNPLTGETCGRISNTEAEMLACAERWEHGHQRWLAEHGR